MLRKLLIWSSATLCIIALLLAAAVCALNTSSVQHYIKDRAMQLISKTLGCNVTLDEAGISVRNGSIALYGLKINDQAGKQMLVVDTLYARMDLWKAYKERHVELEGTKLHGFKANLYKEAGSDQTNFQFILDSIAAHKHKDERPAECKDKLHFDIDHADINRVDLTWQDFNKAAKPTQLQVESLKYDANSEGEKLVGIRGLAFCTNNGKPRKNTGKPNRGAFDAGHLNILLNLDITAHCIGKDSTKFTLHNAWGKDIGSGLVLDSLCLNASVHDGVATLTGIHIKSKHTRLAMNKVTLNLPDSTRSLSYSTSTITGSTILSDISQPFAPALKKFTTPLMLSVNITGDAEAMQFHNIKVHTSDRRLNIHASGHVAGLKHGEKKDIRFAIASMHANNGVKELILSHFPVKQSMMGIIKAAGNITYSGHLVVPKQHVIIGGHLGTKLGNINFDINLDTKQKYLTGKAGTDKFAIGDLVGSQDFKNIAFNADFKFNTAGKKAAAKLHRHLGKLPVGYINGTALEATYKKLTLHNLVWNITSDGDVAKGTGGMTGKLADIMCEFSFTDTEFQHSLKCKPSIKFHSLLKHGNKEEKPKEKTTKKDKNKDSKKEQTEEPKKESTKKKWQFWKK